MRFILFIFSAIFFALLVFCALAFDLPRIVKASGYITGTEWVSKVNTPIGGILVSLAVTENERIKKGQAIGEVTAERYKDGKNIDLIQGQITNHKMQLAFLELQNINNAEIANKKSILLRKENGKATLARLREEIELSKIRLADLERQLKRQIDLVAEGFVSSESLEAKRGDVLQAKVLLSTLWRTKEQTENDLQSQEQELILNASKSQTQRSQLQREIDTNQQEFNEQSAKKIQLISPIDGYVTQLSSKVGQPVRPEIPILSVVPSSEATEALLLLPSRSIGFVRVGQKVSIKYQSYPFEHYGRHSGIIKNISQAAISPQEVVQYIRVDEPVYRVQVSLPSGFVEYQEKKLPITPGMIVDADIELDRLKIYQWLLEPIFRLAGRV